MMIKAGCVVCLFAVCVVLGASSCGGNAQSGFEPDGGPDGTMGHSHGSGGSDGSGHTDGGDAQLHLIGADTGPDNGHGCTGLACAVETCVGGQQTTVEGYVYAPNGQLPLYDVQVYVPNAPLQPFTKGVQCENCGVPLTGNPIATALSDPTGHFSLVGVPTGSNIPIVVQLGKWRRQQYIAMVPGCTTTTLTNTDMTRLPQSQTDSDPPSTASMPHVALTTGGCDQMGCMLSKLGIDATEFGNQSDGYNKAIHIYTGGGGEGPVGSTEAMNLWGDMTNLYTYDEAIFSCECSESLETKGGVGLGGAPFNVVTQYLNAGGRIFTTDFQYTWYKYSSDPGIGEAVAGSDIVGIGEIYGGAPGGASPMSLVTDIPKAVALAAWLKYVFSGAPLPSGTTYPVDMYAQAGEIEPDSMFGNIQYVNSEAVTWAKSMYSGGYGYGPPPPPPDAGDLEPRIFTVDTPVGKPVAEQCGRGVHIDAHVDEGDQVVGPGFPTTGCSSTLKADEAAFAFFFFDLSSCISNEHVMPMPPPPVK
jgi:hypothetical protein